MLDLYCSHLSLWRPNQVLGISTFIVVLLLFSLLLLMSFGCFVAVVDGCSGDSDGSVCPLPVHFIPCNADHSSILSFCLLLFLFVVVGVVVCSSHISLSAVRRRLLFQLFRMMLVPPSILAWLLLLLLACLRMLAKVVSALRRIALSILCAHPPNA